jgi:glucose/arabinose dehydrogenase
MKRSVQRLLWCEAILILTALSSATFTPTAAAAVPSGFTDTLVAAVAQPEGLAFTPDGRLLVSTHQGYVRVIANGTLLPTPALNLGPKLCNDKEGGVPGIAVDPNFATNHYIYLYYTFNKSGTCAYGTVNSPVNRVSRFVLPDSNVIDPASELVLLDNMPSIQGQHVGGDLTFGKDGDLYVSVGDGACDFTGASGCSPANNAARYQNALVGKILRITDTGGIPLDNPFTGPDSGRCGMTGTTTAAKCQETYLWGFRNPFRIAVDPNAPSTRLYVNDVGEQTWEEIDLAQAGADYGWNVREGYCATGSTTDCGPPPAGMTNPIFAYPPTNGCGAITAGAFVPVGIWPTSFDDAYLFGDFNCGKIFQLVPSGGGFTMQEFATGLVNVISMAFGPSGSGSSLYYLTYANGGQVRRIDYVGSGNGTSATFSVVASGDDGDVQSVGPIYPPAGTPIANTTANFVTAGRRFAFGGYANLNGLLRFDTSSLPDNATVTSATLRLYVTGKADADNRNLVAEWYPSSNWPIDSSDYALAPSGTAIPGADINQISTGTTNDFPLTGIDFISKTGFTGLRLQIDGGQPNGDNLVQIASFEYSTLPQAQLIVSYTTGEPLPPENTSPPAVSGTAQAGQTLTASPGSWSGSEPITYAYEWSRCDQAGSNCVPIASGQSYTATADDVGSTLRVAVTATNSAGSATATSAPTAVVQSAASTFTFSILAGDEDGNVFSNSMGAGSGAYPPDGAITTSTAWTGVLVRRSGPLFGGYEVRTGLLRFDSSAIPDGATITSATLRLHVTSATTADARRLVAEWYNPALWPIDAGDYTATAASTAHQGTPIGSLTPGAQNDLPLQNLAQISTTGLTALRLHIDGGQPTGENGVSFTAFEHATLPQAQLIVSYTAP